MAASFVLRSEQSVSLPRERTNNDRRVERAMLQEAIGGYRLRMGGDDGEDGEDGEDGDDGDV